MHTVDIIVPCYNEAEGLPVFFTETSNIINTIKDYTFRYIFIDDGSQDATLDTIIKLSEEHNNVKYVSFSRNFGKEAGMYAGLKHADADYVIIMDADLQHPPSLIPLMIEGIEEGYDCVAAKRTNRKGESKIRSFFSRTFYRLSNWLTNIKLVQGAVDYRIMSRQMVDAVLALSETQRFSKGIFEWVGFRKKWIPYENIERTIGKTKWSFWGLFKYAIDGITAFSVTPLRLVTGFGFFISVAAFLYILATLIQTMVFGIDVPGYVTTLSAVLFLGGIIEFSIGVLGEYIGHIYIETKNRPLYITKSTNIDTDNAPLSKDKPNN
ncbi:MAG: glycosyltransferase family 2 protein [Lachnospiraceae bacterium]|nr:glycosyltransferase family 2 protein [Lachnospiraceae bacterium]